MDFIQRMTKKSKLKIEDFTNTIGEFSAVMEAIDYGILFMDAGLNMRIINRACQHMWGFSDALVARRPNITEFLYFKEHKCKRSY